MYKIGHIVEYYTSIFKDQKGRETIKDYTIDQYGGEQNYNNYRLMKVIWYKIRYTSIES